MNKVILVGRLTRDPEVKNTTTGKAVATFTLAVDRRFKNADGQKEADFVPMVVWGKQAEFAGQYLSKGSQISTAGRLQIRSYDDKDGNRRYVTEVIADEINFLSSSPKKDENFTPKVTIEEVNLATEDDDEIPF